MSKKNKITFLKLKGVLCMYFTICMFLVCISYAKCIRIAKERTAPSPTLHI